MIVKSLDGSYWAHPWPTWSRVRAGKLGESWDLSATRKLKAVFMLAQAANDRILPLPSRQAVCELVDVAGQTFFIMANGLEKTDIRRINILRFHNALEIAHKISVCRLEIGLTGKFWLEIEKTLASLE